MKTSRKQTASKQHPLLFWGLIVLGCVIVAIVIAVAVLQTSASKSVDGDYIGLPEQTALDKAKNSSMPARVVERNGESLPTTMDYVVGRLNLYVKDGEVYKVDVEGEQ